MTNVEKIERIYSLRNECSTLRSKLFDRKSKYRYLHLLNESLPSNARFAGLEALHSEILTLIDLLLPILDELKGLQTKYRIIYQETFDENVAPEIEVHRNFAGDIDGEVLGINVDRESEDFKAVYSDLQDFVINLSPYVFIRSVKKVKQ